MVSGGILSVILIVFQVFTFDRMSDQLWPFLLSKFYSGCYITEWYAVFLFCAVHIQVNPKAYQTFLWFVPTMLVLFLLAGCNLASMNVNAAVSEEFQSGIYAGYYIVCLYPFIWDLRNKILKFILIVLVIYGVIDTMKRGAMVCLALSLLISFLAYYVFFAEGIRRIPYLFTLGTLLSIMIVVMGLSISKKQDTFNHRMQDIQSGSGRIAIYKEAWEIFKSLPPDEKATGTRTPSKQIRAHNDFLFVLVSYGIVGLFFYVLFDIGLFRIWLRSLELKIPMLPGLMAALANISVIQMISYGLEGHAFVICCAYVGIVQGLLYASPEEDDYYDYDEIIEEYGDDWGYEEEEFPAEYAPEPPLEQPSNPEILTPFHGLRYPYDDGEP
jgi:hypothetical protein